MILLPQTLTPALLILVLSALLGVCNPAHSQPYSHAISPVFGYDPAYGTLIGAAWFAYPSGENATVTDRKSLNLTMRFGPHGAFAFQHEQPELGRGWGLDYGFAADNFFQYETENDSTEILSTQDQLTLTADLRLRRSLTETISLYAGPYVETQWLDDRRNSQAYLASGLTLDTRDDPVNSHRGLYAQTEIRWQPHQLTSEFNDDSGQLRADLRGFLPVTAQSTLALRAIAQTSEGPGLLSQIGGADLLRGYLGGQFEADRLAAAQTELRFPIWRFIRGVTFYEWAQFHSSDRWLTRQSGGLGFRFGLPPDQTMSVRWDIAVNDQQQWQSFVSFNQVF